MNIILCGPPGTGKTSQAKILGAKHGLAPFCAGDMLRASAEAGEEIGIRAKAIMDTGVLVPDDLIIEFMQQKVKEAINSQGFQGFIIEGYPVRLAQAEQLHQFFLDNKIQLHAVCEMKFRDEVVIERLVGRYSCALCKKGYHEVYMPTKEKGVCDVCGSTKFSKRPEDNTVTCTERLTAFYNETSPVLDFYKKLNLVKEIDSMATVEDVSRQIEQVMGFHSK